MRKLRHRDVKQAAQRQMLVEKEFHHVGQSGLQLLISSNPPISASQSPGIIGLSHGSWPWTQSNKHQRVEQAQVLSMAFQEATYLSVSRIIHLSASQFHEVALHLHCLLQGTHRQGLTLLTRLVLNSWAQAVFLPQSPKVLGLQGHISERFMRDSVVGLAQIFVIAADLVSALEEQRWVEEAHMNIYCRFVSLQ
ncbi:Protein GVQW1 [Plecturocebus cupreus]